MCIQGGNWKIVLKSEKYVDNQKQEENEEKKFERLECTINVKRNAWNNNMNLDGLTNWLLFRIYLTVTFSRIAQK